MSASNLVLAKRFFEDRTQSDLETFLTFLHPQAEIDLSELTGPRATVYRGQEQLEQVFREMTRPCSEIMYTASNPVTSGDQVVVDVERTVRSTRAAIPVTCSLTALLTVRGGMITHWKVFQTRVDALTAAGLPE